jgi:type I restriction enzyme M protein
MFEQHFKNIDDILHKDAGCTSELDYTEQSSWLLFLKYLDALDQTKADEAALEGKRHSYILAPEFRWNKWAAPKTAAGKIDQNAALTGDDLRDVIDLVDELRFGSQPEKHELSHLYEAKIRNMGNAGRNGGEYYTPRTLIRAMIRYPNRRMGTFHL